MSGLTLLAALKAFDATVRSGSMSAAARQLGLRQPTLSAHIARLERHYGVEVFHRRGRRLELTAFGETLSECTRRAFRAEEDALALLTATGSQGQGHLRVCAVGPYNVMPMILALKRQRPRLTMSVAVGDSRWIVESILDFRGDIGVLVHAADDPDLHCVPYRRQPLVIFAGRSHPLAKRPSLHLGDLRDQEFVMREQGSTTRRVFEQTLHDRGVTVRCTVEMGSREAVREAVAQGLGLGVVADTAYVPDPRLIKLNVTDAEMATHAHVICRIERRRVPLIAEFLKVVERLRAP
jgi:aminoethylphosphonate catabolism LysR family transcriptional regulator